MSPAEGDGGGGGSQRESREGAERSLQLGASLSAAKDPPETPKMDISLNLSSGSRGELLNVPDPCLGLKALLFS